MPLNVTPKGQSAVSSKSSAVIQRSDVQMGRPSASSARVAALKAKLGAPQAQPMTPRPAGSSARAEEMAKLKKFNSPPPRKGAAVPATLAGIGPPPSGLAPGQASPSVEAPTTPPAAAPASDVSPQLEALARQERQIRKARQELKAQQEAWKQEQAKYVPRERLSSETLKVLAEAGITPDKLAELQLNQARSTDPAPNDPQQILLARIAELEKTVKDISDPETGTIVTREKQRDQQAHDQVVQQIREDVTLLVDSNPAFGTIKAEGNTEDVVTLITRVFDEEGKLLDAEEAAQLIEEKLTQRTIQRLEQLTKLSKYKKWAGQAPEASEANTEQRPPLTTLTQQGARTKPLTAVERAKLRVQEAIDRSKQR